MTEREMKVGIAAMRGNTADSIVGYDGVAFGLSRDVQTALLDAGYIRLEDVGAGVERVKVTRKGAAFMRKAKRPWDR